MIRHFNPNNVNGNINDSENNNDKIDLHSIIANHISKQNKNNDNNENADENNEFKDANDKKDDPIDIHDKYEIEYEYIAIMQCTLMKHKILVACEIDCLNENDDFVEIKTCKQFNIINNYINANDVHIPWYKALKYWIQASFANCQHFVIGIRDNNGIVQNVVTLKLNEMYDQFVNDYKRYKQYICLNFVNNLLNFLKDNCIKENIKYKLVFKKPFQNILLLEYGLTNE